MRLPVFICLTLFFASSCDSSSGSKSSPTPPTMEIPTAPSSTGSNAVGEESGGTATLPGTAATGEGVPTAPLAAELKFGLTTTRIDLLKRLGDDLAIKAKEFHAATQALDLASTAYCANPTAESLLAAQESWKAAMGIWQYFEVFQIGPAKDNGQVLKFAIYSWPDQANYCGIDEEALKASKSEAYTMTPRNNRKGLKATEYALFDNGAASRCAATSVVGKEWNALSSTSKVATRCSYLTALTHDLIKQGGILETKWGVPGNNYISQSLTDNAKVNDLIQALYEASYYIDLDVKNQKLAGPAGIDTRYCTKVPEPCLETAEFALSGYSRQAVNGNIAAFTDILFGSATSGRLGGLSALLRAEGGAIVADRSEKIAATLAGVTVADPNSTLDELIVKFAKENCDVSANSWICQTRNGIRQIFTDLKGEYAAILKVKAPASAAGDND